MSPPNDFPYVLPIAIATATVVSLPGIYSMLTAPVSLSRVCEQRGYHCVVDDLHQVVMVLTPKSPEEAADLCEDRPASTQDWGLSIESLKPGYRRIVCDF